MELYRTIDEFHRSSKQQLLIEGMEVGWTWMDVKMTVYTHWNLWVNFQKSLCWTGLLRSWTQFVFSWMLNGSRSLSIQEWQINPPHTYCWIWCWPFNSEWISWLSFLELHTMTSQSSIYFLLFPSFPSIFLPFFFSDPHTVCSLQFAAIVVLFTEQCAYPLD